MHNSDIKIGDKFYHPKQHGYFTVTELLEITQDNPLKEAHIQWESMEGYDDINDYLTFIEVANLDYDGDPIYKFETEQELLQLKLKYG